MLRPDNLSEKEAIAKGIDIEVRVEDYQVKYLSAETLRKVIEVYGSGNPMGKEFGTNRPESGFAIEKKLSPTRKDICKIEGSYYNVWMEAEQYTLVDTHLLWKFWKKTKTLDLNRGIGGDSDYKRYLACVNGKRY